MILYRSESFDDLVNCYKNLKVTNLTEATLVMAALSKIGTSEAFTTATEIMRQPPIISNGTMKSSGGRVTAIYAHFALKLGQYGPAYDALTDFGNRMVLYTHWIRASTDLLTSIFELNRPTFEWRKVCSPK